MPRAVDTAHTEYDWRRPPHLSRLGTDTTPIRSGKQWGVKLLIRVGRSRLLYTIQTHQRYSLAARCLTANQLKRCYAAVAFGDKRPTSFAF